MLVITYTAQEVAEILGLDDSRIRQLCRKKRLGYTLPKNGLGWVITDYEIRNYCERGPLKPGRKKKPRRSKLTRI